MKNSKVIALAAAIFLASTSLYAEKVIKVASWLSPTHPMNAETIPTWGKWVSKATKGELSVKIIYHKGHPKDIFTSVEDGVYDAGWSFHGYLPGRFNLTQIVELPQLGGNAQNASVAYWRVFEKHLKPAKEHEGLEVIALFTHGPGQIMTREPFKSIADLKGKKIRVGGGIQGSIAKLMGVTPVPAPGSKVYEILATGVADGIFMPVGEQKTLRLAEVAPYMFIYPGNGMYLGSFAFIMNPDFLASLPQKTRKALWSVSGEKLSRLAGKSWDGNDLAGYQASKDAGNPVHYATDAEVAEFESLTANLEKEWLASIKDTGVDGPAALKELRATVQKLSK